MKLNVVSRSALGSLVYLTAALFVTCLLTFPPNAVYGFNAHNFNVVKKPLFTGDKPAEFNSMQSIFVAFVALSLVVGKFMGFLPLNVNNVYAKYGHLAPALLSRIAGDGAPSAGLISGNSTAEVPTSRSLVLDYEYWDVWSHAKVNF